jgi:hypothetical protein
MSAQPTALPPDLLQREIHRLLPAVDEGRKPSSRQRKSQLAALLFEAHRTNAHRAWGCENLGQYTTESGMKPAVFAKYKTAGKVLHQREPVAYKSLMEAIRNQTRRPSLPSVTELAAMPSLEKQVGRQHEVVELRRHGAALGKVKTLAQMESYGSASEEGRRVLSSLDGFVQNAWRTRDVLLGLPGDRDIPADQRDRRLAKIRSACEALVNMLDLLTPRM